MCENNENTVVPDDADEDIPFPGGPSSEDVSEGATTALGFLFGRNSK